MRKISELTIKKMIHRPTQSFDEAGKRLYNTFEYSFPYNPMHKGNERELLGAKMIDSVPFFFILFFIK